MAYGGGTFRVSEEKEASQIRPLAIDLMFRVLEELFSAPSEKKSKFRKKVNFEKCFFYIFLNTLLVRRMRQTTVLTEIAREQTTQLLTKQVYCHRTNSCDALNNVFGIIASLPLPLSDRRE